MRVQIGDVISNMGGTYKFRITHIDGQHAYGANILPGDKVYEDELFI
jgi:hypothetical protein